MIDKNVKLNTLYKNRKSKQLTYFFIKINDRLLGARKEKKTDWNFGTWSNYHNPADTNIEVKLPIEEKIKLQRGAIKYLFNGGADNLMI